jgi:hypothetical protein
MIKVALSFLRDAFTHLLCLCCEGLILGIVWWSTLCCMHYIVSKYVWTLLMRYTIILMLNIWFKFWTESNIFILFTGALLFFALLGLSGCFITCYDRRVRSDLAQPCRELCLCCCQPGYGLLMLHSWFICILYTHCSILFQDVCGLSSSWHPLHVDRLHHMLWRLCNNSWGVRRLLGRRRGSRATIAPHNGSDRAGAVHSRRHLLQCTGGNYGRAEDLAKALPHPRQTNANKGEHFSSLIL